MKKATLTKTFALALALGTFGFYGSASADDAGEVITGIIGEVMTQAAEAEAEKQEAAAEDRRCRKLENRCDDGAEWACDKVEAECSDN